MNKKTFLSIVLWLAALVCCLFLADRAMRRDDGERKYGAFFAETQPIDVFFMGTSRTLDGVTPMELWRDYGITGYNMGNSSEVLDVTEQVLRLTFEKQKPKVAMIDVYYVFRKVNDRWTYSYRHMFYDEIPFSRSKFEAIRATLPKSRYVEFMFPFSLYHGRWEEILSGNVERMVDCEPFMMGSEMRLERRREVGEYVRTQDMTDEELPGFGALRRIAALCRENGVEPVFMALPAPLNYEEQTYVNSVAPLAKELGVPFLNMMDIEGLVDFETDCYDYLGHFNPDGASKVTAYLGQWLRENYGLEDRRGDAAYAHWDENLRLYEAYYEEHWGGMTLLK